MPEPTFDHTHVDPCWSVVLDDGTLLTQTEGGTLFGDLPMDQVAVLVATFGVHRHVVHLADGQRPVYFSKVQKRLDPSTGEQHDERRIVCVGWQETVKGTNVKALTWLTEDGVVTHAADDPGEW
jgi:hypothetical protein